MMAFEVEGMSCAHCVKSVTKAIQSLDAASDVQVDLAGKTVKVDRSQLTQQQLEAAIATAGYEVIQRTA